MSRNEAREVKNAETIRESGLLDPEWYLERYRDVAMTGMDPAVHYLRYGALMGRDPGPRFSSRFHYDLYPYAWRRQHNALISHLRIKDRPEGPSETAQRAVMWAAARLAERDPDLALELAEERASDEQRPALDALRANAALHDEAAWTEHVNRYLARFEVAPLELRPETSPGEPSRFHRLACGPLPRVETGPLVSVIMPAWNAEATVAAAMRSVLDQTWRPIELIVVDDASTDGTWAEIRRLAAADDRVVALRNDRNVGPYVSKNLGLMRSRGDYVTGHDADDWAHPQRVEHHVRHVQATEGGLPASIGYMIRMKPDGRFSRISRVNAYSPDGFGRVAFISCLFEARFLKERLGYWDTTRFGADSEMITRARLAMGGELPRHHRITMLCLDLETSLTNHLEYGLSNDTGMSAPRKLYAAAWGAWHRTLSPDDVRVDFPQRTRRYEVPEVARVPLEDIEHLVAALEGGSAG